MTHPNESMANYRLSQNDALSFIANEAGVIEDSADLGSADALIFRDQTGEVHLMLLTSAGEAIKLPVAFFGQFR